jgi:hypothetical protein
MKYTARTKRFTSVKLEDGTEVELELTFQPSGAMDYKEMLKEEIGDKVVIGYLADDSDAQNPCTDQDGFGKFLSSQRHSGDHDDFREALGLNREWEPDLDGISEVDALIRYASKNQSNQDFIDFIRESLDDEEDGNLTDDDDLFKDDTMQTLYDAVVFPAWLTDAIMEERTAIWQEKRDNGEIGNPLAISLDIYDHGGQSWSLSGHGMQCKWDTAKGGGLWVPDKCAEEEIRSRAENYLRADVITAKLKTKEIVTVRTLATAYTYDNVVHPTFDNISEAWAYIEALDPNVYQIHRTKLQAEAVAAMEVCRGCLETWNSYLSDDVYGVVVVTYEIVDGVAAELNSDECWGFYGSDYAYDSLKTDYFQPIVDGLKEQPNG